MSEYLIIRLPTTDNETVPWALWSEKEQKSLALGKLSNIKQLAKLTVHSKNRQLLALAPGKNVTVKKITFTRKINKQLLQSIPYQLEDELIESIDKLHFAALKKTANQVSVAIVAKSLMHNWLTWMQDAGLKCQQICPEFLVLPHINNQLSALKLGDQWLVRNGTCSGFSADTNWLDVTLASNATDKSNIIVTSFSDPEQQYLGQWQVTPAPDPFLLLAQGITNSVYNLLQGEFQAHEGLLNIPKKFSAWKKVAVFAMISITIAVAYKGAKIYNLSQQIAQMQASTKKSYQIFFPNSSPVNSVSMRRNLDRLLQTTATGGHQQFLEMLSQLSVVFAAIPSIKLQDLRFDQKRQELRFSAQAASFQNFEQFRQQASEFFTIEQGMLSTDNDQVTSTIIVRGQK